MGVSILCIQFLEEHDQRHASILGYLRPQRVHRLHNIFEDLLRIRAWMSEEVLVEHGSSFDDIASIESLLPV